MYRPFSCTYHCISPPNSTHYKTDIFFFHFSSSPYRMFILYLLRLPCPFYLVAMEQQPTHLAVFILLPSNNTPCIPPCRFHLVAIEQYTLYIQGRIQDFCQGRANFDKNIFQISLIVGLFHPSNHQMVSTPPAQ